jgi:glycine cleavage system H protein
MILIYLTILVFCLFFAADFLMKRKIKNKKAQVLDPKHNSAIPPISELIKKCKLTVPQGYYLSKRHIWINILASGEVRIGLDALCPKLVTRIDGINLHDPGSKVNKNGSMCSIFQGNKKLKFYSPIDGIVQEVNTELLENPEILCDDPFEKGWIYRIKPSLQFYGLAANQELSTDILDWRESELKRLVSFFLEEPPTRNKLQENIQKGKLALEGLLDLLDSFGWAKFEKSFLT